MSVDPEQASRAFREGMQVASVLTDPDPVLGGTAYIAAQLGDWDVVLKFLPDAIRGFQWLGDRPNQAGQFNLVARAIAPIDPETAALLQGAVRRLVATLRAPRPGPAPTPTDRALGARPDDGAPGGEGGFITALRQETSRILHEALGRTRLSELRAEGAALDDDVVVTMALDAIAKARAGALV